jgi:dienelactone hydrolase
MMRERIALGTLLFAMFLGAVHVHADEWVKFKNEPEKLQLEGILTKPEGKGPYPAVVMLCGCGGLKKKEDAEQQKAWADRLAGWGYVSLRVDSFGPRGYDNICDKTGILGDRSRSNDAYSAKSYLEKLRYIDSKRIAAMGWSHGGWAAMKIIDGAFRDKDLSPFQAAIAFYPWCASLLRFDTPLLILIGEKDDWCPASRCENLKKLDEVKDSKSEFKLIVYANAYHAFDFEGLNEDSNGHHAEYNPEATADAIQQTKDFLAKYLK